MDSAYKLLSECASLLILNLSQRFLTQHFGG